MTENHHEQSSSPSFIQKGKYVFIDQLTVIEDNNSSVPYFSAKAIAMLKTDDKYEGVITNFRISDLILKQSSFIDDNGKTIEAHKLYVWPRNLGKTKEWTASKEEFLNEFILNFPIEIISTQESNGVTWRFITPEHFKKIPEGIDASEEFQEYADHIDEYFFLRRPLNEAK